MTNIGYFLQLVECIRPLLPAIRNTPYGKRIQGKINRETQRPVSHHPDFHAMATMGYLAADMALIPPPMPPATFGAVSPFSVFHHH